MLFIFMKAHLKLSSVCLSIKNNVFVPAVGKLGINRHKSFLKVKEFLQRFASIPNLLELDHLTVSGDVTFGKGVILRVRCNML